MSYSGAEVRALLAARVDGARGVRSLARAWQLSPAYISDVLGGRKAPGPAILRKLRLRAVTVVTYEPTRPERA